MRESCKIIFYHHNDVKYTSTSQNLCGGVLQWRFKQMMEVIPSQMFNGHLLPVVCKMVRLASSLVAFAITKITTISYPTVFKKKKQQILVILVIAQNTHQRVRESNSQSLTWAILVSHHWLIIGNKLFGELPSFPWTTFSLPSQELCNVLVFCLNTGWIAMIVRETRGLCNWWWRSIAVDAFSHEVGSVFHASPEAQC